MKFTRKSLVICILPFFFACASELNNEESSITPGDSLSIEATEIEPISEVKLSNVKCPSCGFEKIEELPEDYCLIKYKCTSCGEIMHPEGNDCCVFCTHGTEKCPSKQED
ncbi:MAG: hypothetical protein ACI857_001633 [Arenicella sp.]|jgi:hypothetical protein